MNHMRESSGKPLPLQMLRLFLARATDAAIDADNQARGRALATTLEKHALQLRLKFGGNTPLQSRNIPKEKPFIERKKGWDDPFWTFCCGKRYSTKTRDLLVGYTCPVCKKPILKDNIHEKRVKK